MEIKCEYCGTMIDDALPECPNCGAPNTQMKRFSDKTPRTIAELEQWYKDRNLPPYEKTRFFIGKNYKGKRAFGIYEENGEFIVYKNKDDGSRAVRYRGRDEAYAVNEIYMKLKSEILKRKEAQPASKPASKSSPKGKQTYYKRGYPDAKNPNIVWLIFVCLLVLGACTDKPWMVTGLIFVPLAALILIRTLVKNPGVFLADIFTNWKRRFLWYSFIVVCLVALLSESSSSSPVQYYNYDDTIYALYEQSYYVYDDGDYTLADYLPNEFTDNTDSYVLDSSSDSWNTSYSFTDSTYYEENLQPAVSSSSSSSSSTSSSSDNDSSWWSTSSDWDSDYDWDSGWDWDSDWGSDWDSDW